MATPPSPNDLTRQQLDELDALLQRMLALPLNRPEPAVAFPPPAPLPEMPPAPATPVRVGGWRMDAAPREANSPYISAAMNPAVVEEPVAAAVLPAPSAFAVDRNFEHAPAPKLYTPPTPTPAVDYVPPVSPGTLRGVDAPATPPGFISAFSPPPPSDEPPLPELSPFRGMSFPEVDPFAAFQSQPAPTPLELADSPRTDRVPVPLWPLFGINWVLELILGWLGPVGHLLTRPWMKSLLGVVGVLLLLGSGAWVSYNRGWLPLPR